MDKTIVADYSGETEGSKVKVYVRVRPMENLTDPIPESVFPKKEEQTFLIKKPDETGIEHKFKFDHIFWDSDDQSQIQTHVSSNLVDHVLQGYHACCFAYGQTGSGKTYRIN